MSVAEHREQIHRILGKVVQDLAVVSLLEQSFSVPLQLILLLVPGRSADAAALTDHALDKVFRKSAELQELQRLLALVAAGAAEQLHAGGILAALLHALKDRVRDSAAVGEALAPDGSLLIAVINGLELDILGAEQGLQLTEGHDVIGIALDRAVRRLGLLRDAGTCEHGDAARIHGLQVTGDAAHRGD